MVKEPIYSSSGNKTDDPCYIWRWWGIFVVDKKNIITVGHVHINYLFSKNRPSWPILSISQNLRLYVCLSVRPCVRPSVHFCLFAPISGSRMSNIFRDSKSLGEKMERSDLRFEFFANKESKIATQKKSFFFLQILPYWAEFVCYRCYFPYQSRDSLSSVYRI